MFKFNTTAALAASAILTLGSIATVNAASVTLTDPSAVVDGVLPTVTTDQAAIGNGSWQAPSGKSSINLTPEMIGLRADLTIADLQSISWQTWKTTDDGANDWYLSIYTVPLQDGTDAGSWYHNRITIEGRYGYNVSQATDQWVTYSSDGPDNQVVFYDSAAVVGTHPGFTNGPTFDVLTSGPVDWSDYKNSGSTVTRDYTGDTIALFVLETGNPWADTYHGYLDNFQVGTTKGDTQVNFDVVPEPASFSILALGSLALLARRRRNRA